MTLAQLSITVALLAALGLTASRVGLSAIPAYLLAGLLLGPNEPEQLALISPSEVTEFVAQLGVVFLLFFLGLEFMLGFAAAGGEGPSETLVLVAKALGFVTAGVAASRWLSRPFDRFLDRLSLEFFLLAVFGFLIASAALAEELGLSEAIGALMAGIVLSETSVREEVEERFFSFRDVFAALFFFVFG